MRCGEHPRARGENPKASPESANHHGTSPRTRGKRLTIGDINYISRNIPAHAGKTPYRLVWLSLTWEHPRARGENSSITLSASIPSGTSPRTRGKRGTPRPRVRERRNIPAHAGKTCLICSNMMIFPEHPRARGENTINRSCCTCGMGTSPRTRGKRPSPEVLNRKSGNIPAHAGKTLIDVRFLVPEGHFTFDFVFLHRGGSMESPCSSLLSECFSARIVVYGQLGTSLLSAYGCAFWWDGG